MANKVLVSVQEIDEPEWISNVENFLQAVMSLSQVEDWDVSVCFCSDEFIKNLNKQYRSIDDATDVLSFEQECEYEDEQGNSRFCAGDIIISIPALIRNTQNFSVSQNDEIKRLLVHGFLDLAGYGHGEYHIGKEGNILDENEKVPVYKDLSDDKKSECDMLVLQEEILFKLQNEKIINS